MRHAERAAVTLLLAFIMAGWSAPAHARIVYDARTMASSVRGASDYVIGVDLNSYFQPLHWGGTMGADVSFAAVPISRPGAIYVQGSMVAQEFAEQGGGLFTDPGVKVAFPDGNRDLVLTYAPHRIAGDVLTTELADIAVGSNEHRQIAQTSCIVLTVRHGGRASARGWHAAIMSGEQHGSGRLRANDGPRPG